MKKLKIAIIKFPFFLVLLPIFFVFHGFSQYFPEIHLSTVGLLLLKYILAIIILLLVCWPIYKDFTKTSLAVFTLLATNLFLRNLLDFIKINSGIPFVSRYIFILPFTFILITIAFIYLKKTKRSLERITLYLNLLFLILLLIDLSGILLNRTKNKQLKVATLNRQMPVCDSCHKSDIYLIIADEYAGKKELIDIFNFDNSAFEEALKKRNFHFVDSTNSNYNATIYSMASILNMDYLNNLRSTKINYNDMLGCYNLIRNNNLTGFLKKKNYSIHNFSFYDLESKEKLVTNHYFPNEEEVLTFQTFLKRLQRDLGFHLFTKEKVEKILRHNMYNNIKTESLFKQFLKTQKVSPGFSYLHLAMPHHSYYNKSNGELTTVEMLTDEFTMDKSAYIEYLKYTNIKLLELIDEIKANSTYPPIIVLMSDHGFRQLEKTVDKKYHFMNLTAVSMPDSNYRGLYNGMSSVNIFRNLLNTQFKQQLPLLKDSTIFLTE